MKTQTILLKITYDENFVEPPVLWDWNDLLDTEEVKIIEADGEKVPENNGNIFCC